MDINKDTKPLIVVPNQNNVIIRTPYQVIMGVIISIN